MHMKRSLNQQATSNQSPLYERLYQHKFINPSIGPLTQKRQIVASQLKPSTSGSSRQGASIMKRNSASAGSLLPQLRQLQKLRRMERQQSLKKNKYSPGIKGLSKLDIYLSIKNARKTQQNNLLFLTSETQGATLSEQQLINKFSEFVIQDEDTSEKKTLRSLLNASAASQLTGSQRANLLGRQKKQLQKIAKGIINQQNPQKKPENQNQKLAQQENEYEYYDDSIQSQPNLSESDNNIQAKTIDWVITECRNYDKRFKVRKHKRNKSVQKKAQPKK